MNRSRTFADLLVEYADQADPPEFVIPEDLSALSDDELRTLHEQAVSTFDAVYGDGSGLSPADLDTLAALTEGIETLMTEVTAREAAATERADAAAALAARAHPLSGDTDDDEPDEETPEDEADDPAKDEDEEDDEDGAAQSVAAGGGKREIRINLGALRSRQAARGVPADATATPRTMRDVVLASGEGGPYPAGTGLDWNGVGSVVDRRLATFNQSQYAQAARAGRHLRQQFGVATIRKPFDPDLVVHSKDPGHVDEVLRRAMDESRLPGGSLLAAGGWCAPSETIYDLCELESRDGLWSGPEIGVSRGGISWTTGPNFSDIYALAEGFSYTEEQDIAGEYGVDANGVGNDTAGDKPCFRVDCPEFEEARLGVDGLCITAGLLQQRGYPEMIARTVRGALVAHDHRLSTKKIAALVAGSTAVTMPADQVGALAPLLDSIEKQVEHYRYAQRMARSTTLEAVFPYWVRGVIRADLSRRTGIDLLSVTDAQIDAWFRSRGINPQFVYDWQPLTGAAGAFTAWPTSVQFLLYAAGTWVIGGSDIITLDTIYDSVLLGQNDFTALFTEEGWLAAKLCHDSRVVTVPLCPDGATAAGVDIACNGTAVVVAP